MHRRIKFRVWNLFLNRWDTDVKLSRLGYLFPTIGYINNDDLVLQLSTNLFDKNGKEVYDGDYVSYYISNPDVTWTDVVVWENYGWHLMHYDGTERGSVHFSYLTRLGSSEVVGNIFENKEMLK